MARRPMYPDAVEWRMGRTEDGRTVRVLINKAHVRGMIEQAKKNATGRCVGGPVTVTLLKE